MACTANPGSNQDHLWVLEWRKQVGKLEQGAFPALTQSPSSCPFFSGVDGAEGDQPFPWSSCNICLAAKVETEFTITFKESQDSLVFAKDKREALSLLKMVDDRSVDTSSTLVSLVFSSSLTGFAFPQRNRWPPFLLILVSLSFHIAFPVSSKALFPKLSPWGLTVFAFSSLYFLTINLLF